MLNRIVWKLISHDRLSKNGKPKKSTLIDRMLQRFFECQWAGFLFKLIAPIDKSHGYASTAVTNENFTAERMPAKSGLIEFAVSFLPMDARSLSWLEVGCCDCANLFVLQRNGFGKLSGVEINKNFLESGKAFDSNGYSKISIYCETLEDFLMTAKMEYDVVFSCAVMQHVNPNNNAIFERMADLAKKYILCVESENQCNPIHYPRNYRNIFEKYGFNQIGHALINSNSYPGVDEGYVGYTIRLFRRTF